MKNYYQVLCVFLMLFASLSFPKNKKVLVTSGVLAGVQEIEGAPKRNGNILLGLSSLLNFLPQHEYDIPPDRYEDLVESYQGIRVGDLIIVPGDPINTVRKVEAIGNRGSVLSTSRSGRIPRKPPAQERMLEGNQYIAYSERAYKKCLTILAKNSK